MNCYISELLDLKHGNTRSNGEEVTSIYRPIDKISSRDDGSWLKNCM